MKLVQKDENDFVVSFSKIEYQSLINIAKSVMQHFDQIDPYILEMSMDEVVQLRSELSRILK